MGVRPWYSEGTVRSAWEKPSRTGLSGSPPPPGAPQAARPAAPAPTPRAASRLRREGVRGLRDMSVAPWKGAGSWRGRCATRADGTVRPRGSLHGAGGEAADDALLGEEEEDQHRQGDEHGAGHDHAPVAVALLAPQEEQADGQGAHVRRGGDDQRPHVLVPLP